MDGNENESNRNKTGVFKNIFTSIKAVEKKEFW